MPGRNGVTAPISPESRTTGTTAAPRSRAGSHAIERSITPCHPRSLTRSVMPLPRFNHFLSRQCHCFDWNGICIALLQGCDNAAGTIMKIYLLVLLIGALLAAIHFTSAPEQPSQSLQQ
jgi:hypothetical protein